MAENTFLSREMAGRIYQATLIKQGITDPRLLQGMVEDFLRTRYDVVNPPKVKGPTHPAARRITSKTKKPLRRQLLFLLLREWECLRLRPRSARMTTFPHGGISAAGPTCLLKACKRGYHSTTPWRVNLRGCPLLRCRQRQLCQRRICGPNPVLRLSLRRVGSIRCHRPADTWMLRRVQAKSQ